MTTTWLAALTLETVIVTTTFGESFKGIKSAVHDDCIVLREAMLLADDETAHVLGGEIVIPREKLGFIQLVPGAA